MESLDLGMMEVLRVIVDACESCERRCAGCIRISASQRSSRCMGVVCTAL